MVSMRCPQGSVDRVAMTQKRGNGCRTPQKLLLEFSAIHTLQQAGKVFVMAQCLAEAHHLSRWSMVLLLNEGMNMPLHPHRRSDQNPAPLFTGPGWARRLGRQREPGLPAFIPRLRRDSLFKRRHIPQINTCVFAARSPGALLNTQAQAPGPGCCVQFPAGWLFFCHRLFIGFLKVVTMLLL